MIQFIQKGGIIMYPIILCSIISLALIIERLVNLRAGKIFPEEFLTSIDNMLSKGLLDDAISLCHRFLHSPSARIIMEALDGRHLPENELRERIELAGRREAAFLYKYLGVLSAIVSISPLLGLLGTVTGMIKCFNVISVEGLGNPATLATGISEALITTAAGLTVAIPSFAFHSYFESKASKFTERLEELSLKVIEYLKEGKGEV